MEDKIQISVEEFTNMNERLEKLTSEKSLLTALINSSNETIIFSLDKDYCYTAFNEMHRREMKKIWSANINVGMNMLKCMHIPELRELAKLSMDRALKGETFSEIQHQPETDIFYEFSWNPVFQNINVVGITAFIHDITEHKRSEEAFHESEQKFRTLAESSPDNIIRYNTECKAVYINRNMRLSVGDDVVSLIGKTPMESNNYLGTSEYQAKLEQVIKTGKTDELEVIVPDVYGELRTHNVRFVPELNNENKIIGALAFGRDITEIKHIEKQILKLNLIYSVLSNINQAIVRIHETKELLEESCRIAVEYGKFPMAWIGMVNSQTDKVEVVASNGISGDYLDKINIDLKDELRSSGTTGIAIKTGKYKISNNITDDDSMIPWKEDAFRYDYKSSASFPLIVFNKVVGSFTIYANEVAFFEDEDINLLDEMAKDISFALEFLENENERKRAEEALRESEWRYHEIFDSVLDSLYLLEVTEDGRFRNIEMNPAFEKSTGLSRTQLIGKFIEETVPEEVAAIVNAKYRHCVEAGHPIEEEAELDLPSGKRYFHSTLIPTRDETGRIYRIIGISRDITENKQAEVDRLAHLQFLRNLDKVNQTILMAQDLKQMMSDVLGMALSIFNCDRTWLFYPCDPDAPSFRVPMEITKPEYPGANVLNMDLPMSPDMAHNLRETLESTDPVTFTIGTEKSINKVSAEQFGVKSMMMVALYPKLGKPWVFGLHQCSCPRVWTMEEKRLFQEIGRRLSDSFTSSLVLQNLKESEEKYRTLIQKIQTAVIVHGADTRIITSNSMAQELLGLTKDQLLGTKAIDPTWHFFRDDGTVMPHEEYPVSRVLVSRQALKNFIVGVHRPGKEQEIDVWVLVNAVPIFGEEDEIVEVIVTFIDITERKQTEEELRQSEERFRRLAENARDVIYRMSLPDGKFEYVSPAAHSVFGYYPEEFYANPSLFQQVIHPDWRKYFEAQWINILKGEMPSTYEYQIIHKSGEVLWLNQRNILVRDEYGKQVAIEGIVTDITPHMQLEESLRFSEAELSALIAAMTDVILVVNAEGRYLKIAETSPALLFKLPKEMLGKTLHEIFPKAQADIFLNYVSQALKTYKPVNFEYSLPIGDKDNWFNATISPMSDDRVLLVARDITERKLAEQRLVLLNFALNNVYDEAYLINEKACFHYVNDESCRALGYSREELLTMNVADVDPDFPMERWLEHWNDIMENGSIIIEGRHRTREGRIYQVEISANYFEYNGQGYNLALTRDITERKQAEEALREERGLFVSGPAVVFKWKAMEGWPVEYVSPNVQDQFGYTPEELTTGKVRFAAIIHPDDLERIAAEVSALSEQGKASFEQMYRIARPDGRYRWIHDFTTVIRGQDGGITHYLGYLLDITEGKAMEEEVRKLNQELEKRVVERTTQLEEANKELESFSYSVSHDLRAPLRGIDGFSLALLEEYQDKIDGQGKNYLQRIRSAAQRMAQLIDDLLSLSRISRTEMNIQQVNLSEMFREIAEDIQGTQPKRKIRFLIQKGIIVNGDSRLLRIVLENLIGNAWKFTSKHPKARIEFGMQQQNEMQVYFIRDDGAGFNMNYSEKLFGAFQRLHNENEFPGTGIGLATVQRIIHRHGGKVWAEGEEEKGAVVYFTLHELLYNNKVYNF